MAESLPPLPSLPLDVQRAVQAARDEDHLRLLEIGFYISGALTALRFVWSGIIALFFAFFGVAAAISAQAHASPPSADDAPPIFVLFFFAIFFGVIFLLSLLLSLIFAVVEIYAGMCLKHRRHPVLIQIVAVLYCLSIPWGTALGIFTLMVLNRPGVRALFRSGGASTAP